MKRHNKDELLDCDLAATGKKRRGDYSPLLVMLCMLFLAGCASTQVTPTPLPTPSLSDRIVATPENSTGCEKPMSVPLGKSVDQTILSGGVERRYLLHVPPRYQSDSSTALVLSFHGHSSNSRQQEERSELSAVADQEGFIAVYPQGLAGADGETGWATAVRRADQVDDVLFISDLLDQLQTRFRIDPKRIYATGFSNGGGMTNLLACSMADRLAAFAPVSGSYPPDPYPGGCRPARPVPLLEIHGTEDQVVPYGGKAAQQIQPIPTWLEEWATRDGCNGQPTPTVHERITELQWTRCKGNATIVHYRISGEAHAWPPSIFTEPGGNGQKPISASLLIWMFFQRHSLPGDSSEDGSSQAR